MRVYATIKARNLKTAKFQELFAWKTTGNKLCSSGGRSRPRNTHKSNWYIMLKLSSIYVTFLCYILVSRRAVSGFVAVGPRKTSSSGTTAMAYTNNPNSFSELRSNSTGCLSQQIPSTSSALHSPHAVGLKIYCDLDGVLADFEQGVFKLLGTKSSKLVKGTMWKHIARANAFYEHLDWTRDGKELWNAIQHLKPDILTGVPYPKSSRLEKVNWCKRNLGLDKLHHVDMASGCRDHEPVNGNLPEEGVTNVITCWSNNKFRESRRGCILIDDRLDLREQWEEAGGLFVHHTDAATTIQKLRNHGIL
eukprot:scaffold22672_cov141-Cylindrotheca_fusiformis.AAC.16